MIMLLWCLAAGQKGERARGEIIASCRRRSPHSSFAARSLPRLSWAASRLSSE